MEVSEKYGYSLSSLLTDVVVRLLSRSGHLNIRPITGTWVTRNYTSLYHFILDLPIWQLLLGAFVFWTLINLIFGALYYVDIQNLGYGEDL